MSRPLPPLFVLRHGETEWNRDGRLQGHLDSPLTRRGRAQAARQGAILRRILPEGARAISSDSGRALATARIALEGLAVPLAVDPRLREVALGRWQGLTLDEVERDWGWLTDGRGPDDWKFDAPEGETRAALALRLAEVLTELEAPTIVVTHGLTSRMLRCLALGRSAEAVGSLPCGQGVVHVIEGGTARTIRA